MGRLKGKRCFITGAGQGIGEATTRRWAAEGAIVTASDLDAGHLQELEAITGQKTYQLDVADPAAVAAVAAEVGAIDVLFNCAGYVHQGTALSTPLEEWDKTFAINSRGVFLVCEAFLPGMIEAGGGSIINMSSIASSEMGVANRFAYGASKAAVIGLTKCLAADFIKEGIRCNAICPATVDSPSLRGRINDTPDPVAARAAFIARQPMGRIGKPEEIAEVATYLACDLSEYMTGQAIVLDGGMHL